MPVGHKCRNLHGHTGQITFTIETNFLSELGMVKDFNEFCFMKQWIDTHLDHALIIARSDEALIEMAESNGIKHFVLDAVQSTSELIAYCLLNVFTADLPVDEFVKYSLLRVDFSETPSSIASVTRIRNGKMA
jgi:6-pyruvoyl-tetrahydropterin synthase